MRVRSVDVYVTYRCNLRCTHCFVGDNLSTAQSFSYESLTQLVTEAQRCWHTEEITFLGGEPTQYPRIADAVRLVQRQGLRARLVTNGLHGFRAFVDGFDGPHPPVVGVSIDGSNAETHDAVRGRRAFERLIANIAHARQRGYQLFGITSLSRANAHDAVDILRLCERLGLGWVNVHYVSNRGFATPDMVLSISEWQRLTEDIEERSAALAIDIRLERTGRATDAAHGRAVDGGCQIGRRRRGIPVGGRLLTRPQQQQAGRHQNHDRGGGLRLRDEPLRTLRLRGKRLGTVRSRA